MCHKGENLGTCGLEGIKGSAGGFKLWHLAWSVESYFLRSVEDKVFHITWLHFIGNSHHINIIMDFERIYFKAQKNPYSQKWCRNPWSKTHGDIISSRSIVRAHDTTSHFWLMMQAYESHRGNFGSRGLEGQEVCLVKLKWFKVDKGKYVAWHVFPNSLNSDGLVCNR